MIVDNALYRDGRRIDTHCEPGDLAGILAAREPGDFVWVGVLEPDAAEMNEVAHHFGLHPLAVEDAVLAHQRPKVEHYGEQLFVVLKTLWYVDEEDAVETGEIAIFVGRDFVVHVRHGHGSDVHGVRLRLESDPAVLSHGPSAVLYALSDEVVDSYGSVIASLEIDVDQIEASVFSPARTDDSQRIYQLKREVAEARRAVTPLRETTRRMASGEVKGLTDAITPYFRDIADHVALFAEQIENLDALLSAAFDAHVARISVQQNEDMRKISAAVALVAGPTLVAAVYGMNFRYMPELEWRIGYPLALVLMAALSGLLWWRFKKSGWL